MAGVAFPLRSLLLLNVFVPQQPRLRTVLGLAKRLATTGMRGAPDILVHQENGLLVPRADPDAFAGAIQRLARDPGFRTRLGISGQEYVNTYLRADQVIPRYEEVYRKAIRG